MTSKLLLASDAAPLTSHQTQSETVGNQNSTTIEASTSTADSTSVTKNSSSVQTSNSHTVSSEKSERSLRQLIVQAINKRN